MVSQPRRLSPTRAEGAPLLLAVETATRRLSVALFEGTTCLDAIDDDENRLHAERLLPAIDGLLHRAGTSVPELAGVALSIGPGSFTGLRIGLATVKGLLFGGTQPVVAVPTLLGLAAATDAGAPVRGALLDARRGEAYAGWCAAGSTKLQGEGVYTPDELAAVVPERAVLAVGEDAGAFGEALASRRSVELLAPVPACARRVGRIGAEILAAGGGGDSERLSPRYLRRAEAEVQRTGERFEALE
ncbi:MAG: tRNA (adenosine(37)-N6)-threonylcarbamoyltransferase complex dimerization subunit type 1 TsaB [Myxococcales bacterium]|nr:tRNA (adenosine(37)-N6)-threonylcarbamoyltransferase complex dimerization subunit type 1 TsaB [Myxococcales bacterium]